MFAVPEEQGENVDNKVNQLFEKLDQESHTADRSRIGQSKPGMLRPIRFKVKRSDSVDQNLRRAKTPTEIKESAFLQIGLSSVEERIS